MSGRYFLFSLLVLKALTCHADSLPEIDGLPYFSPSQLHKLHYFEETTIDAYRKIGSRDPKWNSSAEQALRIYARYLCEDRVVTGTTNFNVMVDGFKKAIAAGCDDPLVRYAALRFGVRNIDIEQRAPWDVYKDIFGGLQAHPYPAMRQAFMYLRATEFAMQNGGSQEKIARMLDMTGIKIAEAIKEKANRDDIYNVSVLYFNAALVAAVNPKEVCDFLQSRFDQDSQTNNAVAHVVRANFFVQWAWDARGTGFADSITPENGRLFEERLAQARNELQLAWEEDPTDGFACAQMITALAGVGEPDAELEKWFERGKQAEPGCLCLYDTRLNFLLPQWGGSQEAMLQLGRECVKEGNWPERIPFVLVDAYDQLGTAAPDDPRKWDEILALYEQYLNIYPADNTARSSYCHYAVSAQKWDLARSLLDQLGDLVVSNAFPHGAYRSDIAQIASHQPPK